MKQIFTILLLLCYCYVFSQNNDSIYITNILNESKKHFQQNPTKARELAKKFVTLYDLSKTLLSK